MTRRFVLRTSMALTLLLAAALGRAWGEETRDLSDKEVIKRLHQLNQIEMEAGSIANVNGGSKRVRDYGKALANDHKKADDEIASIASCKDIEIKEFEAKPAENKEQAATLDELRVLKGKEFDREFLKTMAAEHEKAIEMVTSAHMNTHDPHLRTVLGEMLPKLKDRRHKAEKLLVREVLGSD